jgi:hypothetical protein
LGGRCHVEAAHGTAADNRKYCSKDGDFWEEGTLPSQGNRSDIRELAQSIIDGQSIQTIAQDHPDQWIKYHGGILSLKGRVDRQKFRAFRNLDITVLWGPTGVGKTRYAYDQHERDAIYKINPIAGQYWFDGYEGEPVLIIDEWRDQWKEERLLQLLDGYECQLPIKGSHTYAGWTTVYITSNINPDNWWGKFEMSSPLKRRITRIRHVTEPLF